MNSLVPLLKVLAHGTRWRMVELMLVQPLGIHEVAEVLGLPQSTASSQEQRLRRAGVIEGRRAGHQMRYRVAKEHRRFLHAARNNCGVSARIDRTLLKDAKRAARVVAARGRRGG